VLAYMQAEELDCRGFRQWEEAGRKVKKGSRAVFILRPHLIKTTKKDETGELKEYFVPVGFSPIPVFAASDTEGATPLPVYQPTALPPLFEVAKTFSMRWIIFP